MFVFAENSPEVIPVSGNAEGLELVTTENGAFRSFRIVNHSTVPRRIREAVVLRLPLPCPADSPFYAEGFNMLSQYRGTPEQIESTALSDRDHYKLPVKDGFFTCYNLIQFFPANAPVLLAGFTSCHRFTNEIRFNRRTIEFVVDCDGIALPAGGELELEEFFSTAKGGRKEQLAEFAERIAFHHPPLPYAEPVTGWCSWYCYGPAVTERDIMENGAAMKEKLPGFRFVQIDDGYQAHMGDWLQPHPNFPNGVRTLCLGIKALGLEPAIWVAPFIAEAESELFRRHPDWFIKGEDGSPLPSNRRSFGGWRATPWYMLDGTHPGAREYLRTVFRTMREEWQCRYFKLDANMWGCLPGGIRHDPAMTRVEAFRAGMDALIDGAGPDSVILGCNAPMWPSLGTCTAMRTTGDIARNWFTFKTLARECFSRNWQNRRLWINDPDCLVLENLTAGLMGPDGVPVRQNRTAVPEQEFEFHRAHILASGGMILSGDKLTDLSEQSIRTIRKLTQFHGQTAQFGDLSFRHGTIRLPDGELHCYFNWDDTGKMYCHLPENGALTDFWTDAPVTERILTLPPRSARVIRRNIQKISGMENLSRGILGPVGIRE